MAKISHFVIGCNHETGEFEVCDAESHIGDSVWDDVTEEWEGITKETQQKDAEITDTVEQQWRYGLKSQKKTLMWLS